ncbi:hypothetical protein [Chromobacterium haemolyticum]|uniref:hypothetical protein n=1 Tax=Chromobacterium haemolyticum TaxID=394935 RepID=UPI000DEFDACD|nr:hypothetical protein [Chromobacterium haemolyticum]
MLFSKINDLRLCDVQIHGIFLISCHGFCLSGLAGLFVASCGWRTVTQGVIGTVTMGQKLQNGIMKSEVIKPGNHFRNGKCDVVVTIVTDGYKKAICGNECVIIY